jgi:hypothetical protein
MNKYNKFVDWFLQYWFFTALIIIVSIIIAIPQIRDGINTIISLLISLTNKKSNKQEKQLVMEVKGEKVLFTELLRSINYDVIKVHAYTHILGVAAEYFWISNRYPNSKTTSQSLSTLDMITKNLKYKPSQIHFDIIHIKEIDGHEKSIYFDISDFFSGQMSSTLNPEESIGIKIKEIYKNR